MSGRKRTLLVTGGAGFIGGALCRRLVAGGTWRVVNVDKLTYCGNLSSLSGLERSPNYSFHRADVADGEAMLALMRSEDADSVVHLAAETHVDRSIAGSEPFLQSNVIGTARLIEAALRHRDRLDGERREAFRFLHLSTDEVFGDAGDEGAPFVETSRYAPSSPYAASKAASDHLVRAWQRTYGLPALIANSSNNYGPWQHPEKLIPLMIVNAIRGLKLPVYGDGANVRDWLFVDDHAEALEALLRRGRVGQTYLVGARNERSNIAIVERICDRLDTRRPLAGGRSRRDLIAFVDDRPGHDRRYAVDPSKIEVELGWRPQTGFGEGLDRTIDWYLDNEGWWRSLQLPGVPDVTADGHTQ